MEILIKYRNDRKAEGASLAELNGLDGRINVHLSSSPPNEGKALDLELLSYRRSIVERFSGQNKSDFLMRLDKHIFHLLGSKPARLAEMKVKSIASEQTYLVAVDLGNETVRDLLNKACTVLGIQGGARLIVQGKHHDDLDISLDSSGIRESDTVVICKRLGCDGRCCSVGYGMLCDAFLRDTHALFKDISEAERHKIFVAMSKLKELSSKPPGEVALDEAETLWAKEKPVSALLSAKNEAICWALPTLKRQGIIEALPSLPLKEIISCASLSEAPVSKGEAIKVAALCSNLSEKQPFAATPLVAASLVIEDEDLYG